MNEFSDPDAEMAVDEVNESHEDECGDNKYRTKIQPSNEDLWSIQRDIPWGQDRC